MKKKLITLLAMICAGALLVGCTAKTKEKSNTDAAISNEYIIIKKYLGLEVEKVEELKVTDADIEKSIKYELDELKLVTYSEIKDRAAQLGDVATIDYVGKKDGVAFNGGSDTDVDLELGSGSFIDGFEDGLVGVKVGEKVNLNLKFPDNYHATELAGKEVVFEVTIKKLQEKKYPELTVDILKQIGTSATSVEEYREQLRVDLEKSNKETMETNLRNSVWEALIEQCEVIKFKDGAIEAKVQELEQQYYYYAYMSGMETADFIQEALGMTIEELAKKQIALEYAIEYIAQEEDLEVSDEDYTEGLAKLAEQYGFESGAKMEESYGADVIRESLLQEKVGKFLEEKCVKVESEK